MGKTSFADQKVAARFGRVRALVLAERGRFAVQGCVVAGWRVYQGRRLGPYFRLAYREGRRQRSIYLGRCVELARRVRELLAGLQRPRRERLLFARLVAQVRASLRSAEERLPYLMHVFPLTPALSREGRGRLFFGRSLVGRLGSLSSITRIGRLKPGLQRVITDLQAGSQSAPSATLASVHFQSRIW